MSERAFHETCFKGSTQLERDRTALNGQFVYAIRYTHEKIEYSYYTKSLGSALECKSQLQSMGVSSQVVKL